MAFEVEVTLPATRLPVELEILNFGCDEWGVSQGRLVSWWQALGRMGVSARESTWSFFRRCRLLCNRRAARSGERGARLAQQQ